MADEVQKHMEQIAPSIIIMKESGLFAKDEINLIVSRLKSHECRLASGEKSVERFQAAISYEIKLLCEMKKRRAQQTNSKSLTHLDFALMKRIRLHYLTGLKYFPCDLAFNMQYLHFLSNFKEHFKNFIHIHIQSLLARFSHKPDVYRQISAWYVDNGQPKEAKLVLLIGQSRHPEYSAIYLDLMSLEMKSKPVGEKKLITYLDMMIENKLPSNCIKEAYLMLENEQVDSKVLDYFMSEMKSHYKHDASMWSFITLGRLRGQLNEDVWISSESVEEALEEFKQALTEVSQQKQAQLWSSFLDFILKTLSNGETSSHHRLAVKILEAANTANVVLTEMQLKNWVDLCDEGEGELLRSVLNRRLQEENSSESLWYLYLTHLIQQDVEFKVIESSFYDRALPCVGPNCVRLFGLYLRSADLFDEFTPAKKRQLFETGLKHSNKVALYIKPRYFLFVLATDGIEGARKLYSRLAGTVPHSEELHEEMLSAETKQEDWNFRLRMKTVLDLWMQQFGRSNCKVHMRKVEIIKMLCGPDVNVQIRKVYDCAMKYLETRQLREEFKEYFKEQLLCNLTSEQVVCDF